MNKADKWHPNFAKIGMILVLKISTLQSQCYGLSGVGERLPRMKRKLRGLYACVIAGTCLAASSCLAADAKLRAKYSIQYLGVKVGKLYVSTTIDGDSYSISGGGKTSGVVSVIADSNAEFSSSGIIESVRVVPTIHKFNYNSGKKKGGRKLGFSSGNVVSAKISPAKKIKPGTVPVKASHKLSVLDPISALLIPVNSSDVGNGRKICNRTIPVFDGSARMDIKFLYASSGVGEAEGFNGKTYTCTIRYQPVSGHRPHKKYIKFMQANRDLEITLARIGKGNVYGMFAFSIGTDKGTVSGYATRFASK